MVLRVEFDHFRETVQRVLPGCAAYVAASGASAMVSAADPKLGILVLCHAPTTASEVEQKLRDEGLAVFHGGWSPDSGEGDTTGILYVAAVAYASDEPKPGLWVDAFAERPTLADVLKAMFEEFRTSGEVPEDTSLEEFIRFANPNVVILSPDQLSGFAASKPTTQPG